MKDNLKLVAWLAGAALLVALEVSASVQAFWQIEGAAAHRAQTHATIKKADDLLSALKDAETGQRGYLITGDESFLEPYLAVRDGILDNLAALRQRPMIAAHREHLDAQVPLVTAKLAHMSKLIEFRRNHDMASVSTLANGQGKRLMDAIRAEMKSFIQLEEGALAEDENSFQTNMRQMFIYIVVTSLIIFLLALIFSYLIYRNQQQRLKNFAYLEAQKLLEVQKEANIHLRQANLSLQVSEEKLAVTLNSIGDAVIATDAGARVTLLNPCAENLTGWPQADALGRPVEDMILEAPRTKLENHSDSGDPGPRHHPWAGQPYRPDRTGRQRVRHRRQLRTDLRSRRLTDRRRTGVSRRHQGIRGAEDLE